MRLLLALVFAACASCSSRSTPAKDAGQCVVIVIAGPDAGAAPNPGF